MGCAHCRQPHSVLAGGQSGATAGSAAAPHIRHASIAQPVYCITVGSGKSPLNVCPRKSLCLLRQMFFAQSKMDAYCPFSACQQRYIRRSCSCRLLRRHSIRKKFSSAVSSGVRKRKSLCDIGQTRSAAGRHIQFALQRRRTAYSVCLAAPQGGISSLPCSYIKKRGVFP